MAKIEKKPKNTNEKKVEVSLDKKQNLNKEKPSSLNNEVKKDNIKVKNTPINKDVKKTADINKVKKDDKNPKPNTKIKKENAPSKELEKSDNNTKIDKDSKKSRTSNFKNWWSTNWRKRWFKVVVAITVIISLFLVIFLPILFTVILKDPSNECIIVELPGEPEQVVCAPEDVKATEYDKYKDKATIWVYETRQDELINLGIDNPQEILDDIQSGVNTTIANDKETYKSEHGSGWETQWDNDLEAQGFDSESEYNDSLVAEKLINNSLIYEFNWDQSYYNNFNDLIATIPAEGINGQNFVDSKGTLLQVSSLPIDGQRYEDSTERFVALDSLMYTNIHLDNEGNIIVNSAEGMSPIEFYIYEFKPINISHILFGWTYTNTSPIYSEENITGDKLIMEQVAMENMIKFSIIVDDWVNGSINVANFNFGNLAISYSTDTASGANSGSLGITSAKNTGYVTEFTNAIYLMLSDFIDPKVIPVMELIGGSATLGGSVEFGAIFNSLIINLNNAINSASYLGDFWGDPLNNDMWDSYDDVEEIDNFFNDYIIEGQDKAQIESTLFNEYLSNIEINLIHSRLSSEAFALDTEGYNIYDPVAIDDINDYSLQTSAPYSIIPSRFGLHILRIDQAAPEEIYTGKANPDRANDGAIISPGSVTTIAQEEKLIDEIGYRMIRSDLTNESDKKTPIYNVQDSYNQFITNELENWIWDWAFASSFDENGNVRNDSDAFINWAGDDVDKEEMERIQAEAEATENANDIMNMLNITGDIEEYYEENVFVDELNTKIPAFAFLDLDAIKDWIIYVTQDILDMTFNNEGDE